MNVVTEPARSPAAVLIRALEPLDGIALMRAAPHAVAHGPAPGAGRAIPDHALCRGPGNVTHAMGITLKETGIDSAWREALHRGSRAIGSSKICVEPAHRHQRWATERALAHATPRDTCRVSGGLRQRPLAERNAARVVCLR